MKTLILICLLVTSSVFASGPGFIAASNGGMYYQKNVNGQCGASDFNVVMSGSYKDDKGAEKDLFGCLNSVAMPLSISHCKGHTNGYIQSVSDFRKFVKSGAIDQKASMVFIAPDMENPYDMILTSIDCGDL